MTSFIDDISDIVFNTGTEIDAVLITANGSVPVKIHYAREDVILERNGYAMRGEQDTVVVSTKVYNDNGKPKQITISAVSFEVTNASKDENGLTILTLK